jgi:pilus assembly protein Flp/PilA
MLNKLKNLVVEEEGQALTEYGLIIGVVAVLIVASLVSFRSGLEDIFTTIINKIKTPGTGTSTT